MKEESLVVRCLRCGTKNRIPSARLNDRPVCGQCHTYLDDIIIYCLRCGTKNKMPEHRLHERPFCGACGALLVSGETPLKILDVDDGTFQQEVLHYAGAVVVICWSVMDDAVFSHSIDHIFADLATQYSYGIKTTRLKIDESPLTVTQYNIRSTPAILFFKEGQLLHALVENLSREEIERHISTIAKIS